LFRPFLGVALREGDGPVDETMMEPTVADLEVFSDERPKPVERPQVAIGWLGEFAILGWQAFGRGPIAGRR
jgi:hypothetical protein